MMLSREEVEALLVCRVLAATESCNSYHINRVEGQIDALVAVLTGKPPGRHNGDTAAVMKEAGIPCVKNEAEGTVEWSDDWLRSRGFEMDEESGEVEHPRFGEGW